MSYELLAARQQELSHIGHVTAILSWDEAVVMPAGGGAARADALAGVARIHHRLLTAGDTRELIGAARGRPLDPWQQANLREIERQYDIACCLPERLVAELSHSAIVGEQAWRAARARNDWQAVEAPLTRIVDLVRERAERLSELLGVSPYESLLQSHQSGVSEAAIDTMFDVLRGALPGLIARRLERQRRPLPFRRVALEAQRRLSIEFMGRLGFDFSRGRLDTSHHPFCGGVPDDTRITTRYDEHDFLTGLMATLHETGHALYEQGLPVDARGQPVGMASGAALHESQSLLVEMQICRGRPFLEFAAPILAREFGVDARSEVWSVANLECASQQVERGLIRVDADELTYPLHVMIRHGIERDLIAGAIDVTDVPAAWDEGMRSLLGIDTAGNFRDGCMQDVHWFAGLFGYFPCYTLGAVIAAQLFATVRAEIPDIDDAVRGGRFDGLRAWLRRAVHGRGRLLDGLSLVAAATGKPLAVDDYVHHLQSRYGSAAS